MVDGTPAGGGRNRDGTAGQLGPCNRINRVELRERIHIAEHIDSAVRPHGRVNDWRGSGVSWTGPQAKAPQLRPRVSIKTLEAGRSGPPSSGGRGAANKYIRRPA